MPPSIHHLFLPAVVTGAGGVVGVDGRETGGGWGKEVPCDSTALTWCTLNNRNWICACVCVCVCRLEQPCSQAIARQGKCMCRQCGHRPDLLLSCGVAWTPNTDCSNLTFELYAITLFTVLHPIYSHSDTHKHIHCIPIPTSCPDEVANNKQSLLRAIPTASYFSVILSQLMMRNQRYKHRNDLELIFCGEYT